MFAEIPLGPFSIEYPKALIAILVGFAMLLFLVRKFALPSMRDMLSTRTTQIEQMYSRADQQLAEAKQIRDDYANRIAQIEIEHRQRLDAAVRDADAASADIIADARETVRALHLRAEEEVARERTRRRILLRRQVVQITLDAAEQSVRDLNSTDAQHRLIADFIARAGSPRSGVGGAQATESRSMQSQTQTQGGV